MTDIALTAVFALVALAALGGWAATLIALNRSILPNAQALQALTKVNEIMDQRIKETFASFKNRDTAIQPTRTENDPIVEIRRRAAAMGITIDTEGNVRDNRPNTTLKPPPDPASVDALLDVVEA
jgi:hypothetical protein